MLALRLHRPTLLFISLVGGSLALASCSSEPDPISDAATGTVGATTTAAGTGGGATATTGAGGAGGAGPLAGYCSELCAYLDSIACMSWDNCETECPAPPGCPDEYEAKVKCWVENKADFTCTPTQVVPPAACKPLEDAFNDCFGGAGGGNGCAGQVCNHSGPDAMPDSCSCKTSCGDSEFKSACSLQGADYACSCYNFDKLLGTCSETAPDECDNYTGCCESYFVP